MPFKRSLEQVHIVIDIAMCTSEHAMEDVDFLSVANPELVLSFEEAERTFSLDCSLQELEGSVNNYLIYVLYVILHRRSQAHRASEWDLARSFAGEAACLLYNETERNGAERNGPFHFNL